MTNNYTFRILKQYRKLGITKRLLLEKSTKPHTLEHCIKVYGVHFEHNKDPKTRIILELDDLSQVSEHTAEQKGFYILKEKQIVRPKPKQPLGSQNQMELLYCHHCPLCKQKKPKHGSYHERGFSKKGLMMHLDRVHSDEPNVAVYIQALPVRI